MQQIPDGNGAIAASSRSRRPATAASTRTASPSAKRGPSLHFCNTGSSPQIGSINCTANAWKGSIVAAINPAMMYDQLFAIGGALRHCHFEPEDALINSAVHPVAVSNTSPCLALNTIAVGNNAIGRMLASGGSTKEKIVVSTSMSTYAVDIYSGSTSGRSPTASPRWTPSSAGSAPSPSRTGSTMAAPPGARREPAPTSSTTSSPTRSSTSGGANLPTAAAPATAAAAMPPRWR